MSDKQALQIGVLGTGAIGGFYGALLARAGYSVHFYARSDYASLRGQGICIQSEVMGTVQVTGLRVHCELATMPACDWLLVTCKTTSNPELGPLINQMTAVGGKVVLLQNGFAVEDALRPMLRDDLHVLGGLCYIYAQRTAPGQISHQANGMINLGYHSGPATSQPEDIVAQGVQLFTQAGLKSQAVELARARWHKLVWNVPYNGLSVLLNATTGTLMAQTASRSLIEALMQEVVDAAAACGQPLPDHTVATMLRNTDAMPDYYPSMYHDFSLQQPLELEAMYRAPLAAAQTAGVAMPKVEMLLQTLEFLVQEQAAS